MSIAFLAIVGCGDEDLCGLGYSAHSGDNCEVDTGECYSNIYRMICERNATDDGYVCECYFDGELRGDCENFDVCDEDGPFFNVEGDAQDRLLYSRMETCCGFDLN